MSNNIETRIVQMQFENSQFEKGVDESIKALEKLKKGLDLKGASSGLDHLRKVGDSFSLTRIGADVDAIAQKFTVLGTIGRRVLENIADGVYQASVSFAKDLSVNNISAGFDKYNDKVKSVQTIMNATGKDIAYVDEQLSKLQWFTDETSYNYADMVSNIGKFTSMNIDLETSVTAMQGIANWAAVSGQGVNEAGRAMYNMAQAIGVGAVKLADWRSIELANMGTAEFKTTVIDTAKALGVLNKESKTSKGTLVNIDNFSSTLAEGWFSKDVLLESLRRYGEYADEVYKVATERGITAAQAMEFVSAETMKLGEKAFKAAQEYTNFRDTITAVKDAVSTGWMQTFELVFGNYVEGKKLWTALGDTLYEVFATGVQARNELLTEWKEIGGQVELVNGLIAAFEGLLGIVNLVRDAFREVFPQKTAEELKQLTDKVSNFGKRLKELYAPKQVFDGWDFIEPEIKIKGLENIDETLKRGARGDGVKELQKKLDELGYGDLLGKSGVDGIFGPKTEAALKKFVEDSKLGITDIYDAANKQNIVDALGLGDRTITGEMQKVARYVDVLTPEAERLKQTFVNAFSVLKGVFERGTKSGSGILPTLGKILASSFVAINAFLSMSTVAGSLENIVGGVVSAFGIFLQVLNFVIQVIGHLIPIFRPFIEMFIHIGGAIGQAITSLNEWLASSGFLTSVADSIGQFLKPVADWASRAAQAILDFLGIIPKGGGLFGSMGNTISKLFGVTKKGEKSTITLKSMFEKLKQAIDSSGVVEKLSSAFKKLKSAFKSIKAPMQALWASIKQSLGDKFTEWATALPEKIGIVISAIGSFISKGIETITPWIQKIPSAVSKIRDFFKSLTAEGNPEIGKKPGFLIRVRDAFKSLVDFLFGKGDPTKGKQNGIFRKLWLLITGDLDGFTEGMSEEDKQKTLDRINGIKDFITNVRDAIVLLFGGNISEDSKLSKGTIEKIEAFKSFIRKVISAVKGLFTGKFGEDSELSEKSKENILRIHDTVISFINLIKDTFVNIWNTLKGIITGEIKFDSIEDFITKLREGIKKFFSNLGEVFKNAFNFEGAGEKFGKIFEGIKTFFSTLLSSAKDIGKYVIIGVVVISVIRLILSLTGVFNKLKDVINSFKQNTQALSKSIMQFAIAIGIVAASIWLIAQLKPEQLRQGGIAIVIIFAAIIGMVAACAKFMTKNRAKVISQVASSIKDFAIAIGILVAAIVILSIIPWKTIVNGGIKLVVISAVLIGIIKALNKLKATTVNLKGLIGLSAAIGILAIIVAGLSLLSYKRMIKGLVGLLGIVAILSGLMFVMGKVGATKIKMKGFIALSIAIGILAIVVGALGKMKLGKFVQGIIGLAVIVGSLAVLIAVLGAVSKSIDLKSALVLVGGVMLLIATFGAIMYLVKDIDPSVMYGFSISLAIALAAFVAACMVISKLKGGPASMLSSAAGLAAGIVVLIGILGSFTWIVGELDNFMNGGLIESIKRGGIVLTEIGNALGGFKDAAGISGIEVLGLLALCEKIGLMPGGALAAIAGGAGIGGAIGVLIGVLGGVIAGLGGIDELTNGGFVELIEKGAEVFSQVGQALGSFVAGIKLGAESKKTEQETGEMKSFAEAFKEFGEAIAGMSENTNFEADAEAAKAQAIALHDFFAGLEAYPLVIGSAYGTYTSAAGQLSTDMNLFGQALRSFIRGVVGFSAITTVDADTSAAIKIAEQMHSFFNDLEPYKVETTGWSGTYFTAPEQLSTDIAKFATAMNQFGILMAGFSEKGSIETDTTLAISIAGSVKDFFDQISSQTPTADYLIEYNRQLSSTFSNVTEFAATMSQYQSTLNGIAKSTISADTGVALENARAIVQFLIDIKAEGDNIETNKGAFEKWFTGDTAAGTVFEKIQSFGQKMGEAAANLSGIGGTDSTFTADFEAGLAAVRSMAEFLSEFSSTTFVIPDPTSIIGMEGSLDRFGALMYDIGVFAQELKSYANITEGVDYSSLANFTTVIANLKTIMSGTGDDALTSENFVKGLDPQVVITKLSEFVTQVSASAQEQANLLSQSTSQFNQSGSGLIDSMASGISGSDAASDAVSGAISKAASSGMQYQGKFKGLGLYLALGLAQGVRSGGGIVSSAVASIVAKGIAAGRAAGQVASPSRATMEIGKFLSLGLAVGITKYGNAVTKSSEEVTSDSINTLGGMFDTIGALAADDINTQPIISPVVDTSNVRMASGYIDGMFGDRSFGVRSTVMASSMAGSTDLATRTPKFGSPDVVNAVKDMNDRIGTLGDAISSMQMVVDTGALVGQVANKMDQKLGVIAARKGRLG